MEVERTGLSGIAVLIGLIAAVLVGFTILLLVHAHHNQALATDATPSASAALAASH
ncbi:MAG: hypothetical protein ACXU8S_04060 [Phenylobacterium sp.]